MHYVQWRYDTWLQNEHKYLESNMDDSSHAICEWWELRTEQLQNWRSYIQLPSIVNNSFHDFLPVGLSIGA